MNAGSSDLGVAKAAASVADWPYAARSSRARRVTASLASHPHVLIDRLDPDTEALALHLAARGGVVSVAPLAGQAIDPASAERLQHANVDIVPQGRDRVLDFDIVFVHDYTSPLEQFVVSAREHGRRVAQFADVLLEAAPCPTVGVTGSAGKSSIASLVGEMLIRSGIPVYTPRAHFLPDSRNPNRELFARLPGMTERAWQVVELTSSHLEYMTTSPEIAVVTRLHPDHVEWHGSTERYFAAKARITAEQTSADWLIVNDDDEGSREVAQRTSARVAAYSVRAQVDHGAYLRDGMLVATSQTGSVPLIARSEIRLQGRHLENALAATAAALAAGASRTGIADALRFFPGLRHRLELVAERGSVRAFNDGIAFTPAKAEAGIEGFGDRSVVLICGGEAMLESWSMGPLHGSDLERARLAAFARTAESKVRRAFVVGEMADTMRAALEAAGMEPSRIAQAADVASATAQALAGARPGDNVVLSPIFYIDDDAIAAFDHVARAALQKA